MGRCCRAEHICGLTEFIEDVVGGGGGGGTPGSPVNSVQYNSAGAFAGSSNLTYDGTSLKVTGQIQFNGTSNLYPMFKASSATTTELQARLADDTDLTEFRAKFLYAGATTGAVRLNAAGQGIAVLTNNAGSDLARLCLGGSTSLFPALKRSGADVHLRLADDSAFANLQLGNLNVSGLLSLPTAPTGAPLITLGSDTTSGIGQPAGNMVSVYIQGTEKFRVSTGNLTYVMSAVNLNSGSGQVEIQTDAADILAQRRTTNAQQVRIYETYTSGSVYSRGVFGFRDSAGATSTTLRIGTEHAGAGMTAKDVAIITDSSPRMIFYGAGGINCGANALTAYQLQQTSSRLQIQAPETISSATATGTTGQICWDTSYIYVCTATDTWKRVAIATWP